MSIHRPGILVYGACCYLAFALAISYLAGFIGDLIVPKTIDRPVSPELGLTARVGINVSLVLLFGAQHSVMARKGFKRRLTSLIPLSAERSTFVLATAVVFGIMFWFWQPIETVVWSVESTPVAVVLWIGFGIGWILALVGSVQVSHAELFGIRQTWSAASGREPEPLPFVELGLYRHVRHPINLGFLMAVWIAPQMTAGHLLFAVAMTIYLVIGTVLEERDLVRQFGDRYRDYQRRVPSIIPTGRRR